jgi:hypothetical protein
MGISPNITNVSAILRRPLRRACTARWSAADILVCVPSLPGATRTQLGSMLELFIKPFNLYLNRVNELRQYGEILDSSALEPLPIPLNLLPRLPSPTVRADEEEATEPLEIVVPQALPNG